MKTEKSWLTNIHPQLNFKVKGKAVARVDNKNAQSLSEILQTFIQSTIILQVPGAAPSCHIGCTLSSRTEGFEMQVTLARAYIFPMTKLMVKITYQIIKTKCYAYF